MTDGPQHPEPDPGTGLAPDDLEEALADLDGGDRPTGPAADAPSGATQEGHADAPSAATQEDHDDAAGGATPKDHAGAAPEAATDGGAGGDRERLAAFARSFGGRGESSSARGGAHEERAAGRNGRSPAGDASPRASGGRADGPRDEEPGERSDPTDGAPAGETAAQAPSAPSEREGTGSTGSTGPDRAAGSATPDGSPQADATPGEQAAPASTGRTPATALRPSDVYRIVDGKERRDTAWSRFVARTRDLFTASPAQEEARLDHELEELRLHGLSQGVTVALGSIKGGAGKTTLTLTLAEVLANALRVGVLVVDADLEFGTASDSVPDASRNGGTLMDVHRARERITTPGDLAPYLVTLPSGAQLLAGPTDASDIEEIDTTTMTELLALLRRFYPVILIDLPPGMGLRGSIPRWGFGEADDIVLVTTPKRANVKQMGHMLGYVSEHHAGVPLTLAINMVPSRLDEAGQRVVGIAQGNGHSRRSAEIPNDPVLARQLDAGTLDVAALDQRTRIAAKDLTVSLASGWCR